MATATLPSSWRYTCRSPRARAARTVALEVTGPDGATAAVARVHIATRTGRGRLSVRVGPWRPPTEVIGRLVRLVAAMAADAGARSLRIDFDTDRAEVADILAASELEWTVHRCGDHSAADAPICPTS